MSILDRLGHLAFNAEALEITTVYRAGQWTTSITRYATPNIDAPIAQDGAGQGLNVTDSDNAIRAYRHDEDSNG